MSGPVTNTQAGKVRGLLERSVLGMEYCAFKGIPFAKPPIGKLRFQDPVPAESWTGVRDAKDFGPSCAQLNLITMMVDGSDDCLYLNVYAQSLEPQKSRPVMVWIHGGGFICGSGDDSIYGPDYLLRKDIVLVTINYRVGVLGFLNLEDEIAPGNQGLKDQVLALKWVRHNIANFGGDPDNVTIFGESAGGASVHYLCLSSLARGLFHKAIIQSGSVVNPWASLTHNPKQFAYRLCERLGIKTRDHNEIVEYLRIIDAHKLIDAQNELATPEEKLQFTFVFGPGIDEKSKNPFMPVHPEVAAAEGVQLPLLIGCTEREGIVMLSPMTSGIHFDKFERSFAECMHPTTLDLLKKYNMSPDDLRQLYCKNDPLTSNNVELIDLLGDVQFVEGVHRTVKTQVAKSCAPTYLYRYSYSKGVSLTKTLFQINMKGASHGDELIYLFKPNFMEQLSMKPLQPGSSGYKIMRYLTELWTNFAATGRPTPTTNKLVPFYWPPVSSESVFRYLDIDEQLQMKVCLNLEEHYKIHRVVKNKL